MFREFCIDNIQADEKRCKELLDKSTAIATGLNPYLGYQVTSKIVKEALKNNASIKNIILEYKLIDEKDLNKILSLEMTQPKEPDKELIFKIKNNKAYSKFLEDL